MFTYTQTCLQEPGLQLVVKQYIKAKDLEACTVPHPAMREARRVIVLDHWVTGDEGLDYCVLQLHEKGRSSGTCNLVSVTVVKTQTSTRTHTYVHTCSTYVPQYLAKPFPHQRRAPVTSCWQWWSSCGQCVRMYIYTYVCMYTLKQKATNLCTYIRTYVHTYVF